MQKQEVRVCRARTDSAVNVGDLHSVLETASVEVLTQGLTETWPATASTTVRADVRPHSLCHDWDGTVRLSWIVTSALFFFQAEDGIRDSSVTGVQTCALPI